MTILISIGLAIWISCLQSQSAQANINTGMSNDFYSIINQSLSTTALNCTNFITPSWRKWMKLTDPPDDLAGGQMLVLLKSLLSCLHWNLKLMNETSPFALTPQPQILYNVALNEVVSLSFDGILITKVLYTFLNPFYASRLLQLEMVK